MKWLEMDTDNCSIQRALAVVGEKWTIQVLRETFNGVRRFDQIRDHTGMSDAVLSDRLRTLVAEGVLKAMPYQESGRRTRHEYRLTEKGHDLYPLLIALLQWGDRYYADREGPAVIVAHEGCGEPIEAVVECVAGHRLATAADSYTTAGPGVRQRA